jgi:hypothetical protein
MWTQILSGLGYLLKLEFLAGVRTYVAAVGLVGLALSQFAAGQYDAAVQSFLAALALVGLRAKLDGPAEPK